MSTKVYVGNLPVDVQRSDIERLFDSFGPIEEIAIKVPARPPAFAFIVSFTRLLVWFAIVLSKFVHHIQVLTINHSCNPCSVIARPHQHYREEADAMEAVRARQGYEFAGDALRVELSRSRGQA
jgi:RNA recognition motif-containing protein